MSALTVDGLHKSGGDREPLVAVTAYDYTFARLADEAGVDILLVGDSLGMVVQGEATTLPVTLDHMVYHTRCVSRGRSRALVVADLPFRAYKASPAQALDSAARLMAEGGCEMVKLEGGRPMVETVAFLQERDIPVMGHLGLTPQSVHQLGGYRVQGRSPDQAAALVEEAMDLERAGARALVLEAVPREVARRVTESVDIPVIGIGAGPDCDGQVLVLQDALGLFEGLQPRFAKRYMDGAGAVRDALGGFCREVRSGAFPADEHSFE
ncbi:3-methyl-2-oxobutanoate hydroxymethyltransferase [Thiohalorhabdus denitrificans]|uniref:3-methyl-2-oxobutanoate hydroxymethyltransferase n=1 Tax=Thiohalorhabdus denitrificans TaxID=381306 RepID=A0A0P9ED52_9GAMM|nr:3-methyl-2-oxobutanoate hydroxymethyltransferase [Thiohalorhabdus denitrificans]KPV40215.1 3-methyl-2-oxobutanoate hydroxymethyltransferase [Thiohalorhabdus denitrificans]SCX84255.1 ketopantoate hydroxymethyltransferase [Thiohalorhabdus denitrificans]